MFYLDIQCILYSLLSYIQCRYLNIKHIASLSTLTHRKNSCLPYSTLKEQILTNMIQISDKRIFYQFYQSPSSSLARPMLNFFQGKERVQNIFYIWLNCFENCKILRGKIYIAYSKLFLHCHKSSFRS
jgi:hypothetical protein